MHGDMALCGIVALDAAAWQHALKVAGLMWRMEEEDGKRKYRL
jgi:aminoglycoside/choline kinase family phosphotransferase